MHRKFAGFTLIELLIVVAIIAILAAIAVPNFLEAQTRSKVSRAKADMRSMATGLESYYVDNNKYPDVTPSGPFFATSPVKLGLPYSRAALSRLSTPIAYMTTGILPDPFAEKEVETSFFGYAYAKEASMTPVLGGMTSLQVTAGPFGADVTDGQRIAEFNTHLWFLQSVGPDRKNFALQKSPTEGNFGLAYYAMSYGDALGGTDSLSFFYDPTNGTVSRGDIIRSAKISKP